MGFDHLNATIQNPTTHSFFPHTSTPSLTANIADITSTELFTLPGLLEAFDLRYITRRRAVVNFDKLDWVNRMHLRREAMVDDGGLAERFMGLLGEVKVL